MNKKSKIFIAGHKGLVGSAILRNLQSKNYSQIICKDRKELDLLEQRNVEKFFENERPEYVFLAAAKVGGIEANNKYRADFIYENLMIQNNIIYNSYKTGVKKLLFLGSSCVYPKKSFQPIKENSLLTSPLEPTNEPYALAKIAGLKMCESFNLQYDTNYISVMPTNLYGPNDNFDFEKSHVLPALIRKIYLGKCLMENKLDKIKEDVNFYLSPNLKITSNEKLISYLKHFGIENNSVEIWGTGKPMREFLWSEDLADACVFLMENKDFIDLDRSHINIGTGVDISIKNLALLIKNKISYKGNFIFNSSKPDGTMKKLTDISKLKKIGWNHKVSIEKGVEKLIEIYINSQKII